MTPEIFIENIYKEIIENNYNLYQSFYSDENLKDYKDQSEMILFIKSLNPNHKKYLFRLLKQTSIDTLSNIFGIIDGSSYLEGIENGEFELFVNMNDNKNLLSGDLQDLFLELNDMNIA